MKSFFAGLLTLILLIVGGTVGGWFDTWFTNKVEYIDRKIDDATNYETLKKVEDTCRAMQASYESDRLTYEQYKDSDNEEKQSGRSRRRCAPIRPRPHITSISSKTVLYGLEMCRRTL